MGRFGMYPLRQKFTGRPIFISEKMKIISKGY